MNYFPQDVLYIYTLIKVAGIRSTVLGPRCTVHHIDLLFGKCRYSVLTES